jgi:hypothetical protein
METNLIGIYLNFLWTKWGNSKEKICFRWRRIHVIGIKDSLKDLSDWLETTSEGARNRRVCDLFFKTPIHKEATINGTIEAQLRGVRNYVDLIPKKGLH